MKKTDSKINAGQIIALLEGPADMPTDGLTCSCECPEIITGPDFGCVHWKEK